MIVFPDDAEFRHIPQCTTGRVYLLRFKNNRKMFFWMQVSIDVIYCKSSRCIITNYYYYYFYYDLNWYKMIKTSMQMNQQRKKDGWEVF